MWQNSPAQSSTRRCAVWLRAIYGGYRFWAVASWPHISLTEAMQATWRSQSYTSWGSYRLLVSQALLFFTFFLALFCPPFFSFFCCLLFFYDKVSKTTSDFGFGFRLFSAFFYSFRLFSHGAIKDLLRLFRFFFRLFFSTSYCTVINFLFLLKIPSIQKDKFCLTPWKPK